LIIFECESFVLNSPRLFDYAHNYVSSHRGSAAFSVLSILCYLFQLLVNFALRFRHVCPQCSVCLSSFPLLSLSIRCMSYLSGGLVIRAVCFELNLLEHHGRIGWGTFYMVYIFLCVSHDIIWILLNCLLTTKKRTYCNRNLATNNMFCGQASSQH